MLKPGGVVVYSTCTFSPQENEQTIEQFLRENPDFELLHIGRDHGISGGRRDWVESPFLAEVGLDKTVRIWPHRTEGEGHYVALLKKKEDDDSNTSVHAGNGAVNPGKRNEMNRAADVEEYHRFVEENLTRDPLLMLTGARYTVQNDRVFLYPAGLPELNGLKVIRKGWFLGTLKKKRFEPSQAFVMGLQPDDLQKTVELTRNDPEVYRYLRGETIRVSVPDKGWTGVAVDGFLLGWAKSAGNQLKNQYPPGWRMLT